MAQIKVNKPIVLTGEEMLSEAQKVERAEIEAKRGIVRDRDGGIVLSKEQREARIEALKVKKNTIKATKKDAEAKIAELKGQELTEEFTKEIRDEQVKKQENKIAILLANETDLEKKITELE